MRYEIVFAPEAEEDLRALRATDRATVLDAIETHLRYEPEKVSQSRIKRLDKMAWPQYRLRIGDIRAFYDVVYRRSGGVVEIIAIRQKKDAIEWLSKFGRQADDPGSAESSEG